MIQATRIVRRQLTNDEGRIRTRSIGQVGWVLVQIRKESQTTYHVGKPKFVDPRLGGKTLIGVRNSRCAPPE